MHGATTLQVCQKCTKVTPKHYLTNTISCMKPLSVCKRRGLKLVVVPACARYQLFLDKLTCTLLPVGARCCSGHLSDNYSYNHAVEQLNHSGLMELSTEICYIASRGNQRRLDFDNRNSLSDADILNLTGLSHNNFDDLCGIIQKVTFRDSRT